MFKYYRFFFNSIVKTFYIENHMLIAHIKIFSRKSEQRNKLKFSNTVGQFNPSKEK